MDVSSLLERACARAGLTPALVRPTSEGLESRCPFCRSRKASLGVTARARGKGAGLVFSCLKCHASGGAQKLADKAGVSVEDIELRIGRPRQCFDLVQPNWWMPFVRTLANFLVEPHPGRGLREQEVQDYRIGYDWAVDELVIPTFNQQGVCVGVTRREAQPGCPYVHTKFPRSQHLYGAHLVDPAEARAVAVSEGQLDAPALPPFLPPDVPSVATLGAAMSRHQARILAAWGLPVWMAYDNDDAGLLGTARAVKLLREAGVTEIRVLLYPGSDPGGLPEVHRKNPADVPAPLPSIPYMKWLLQQRANIHAAKERLRQAAEAGRHRS